MDYYDDYFERTISTTSTSTKDTASSTTSTSIEAIPKVGPSTQPSISTLNDGRLEDNSHGIENELTDVEIFESSSKSQIENKNATKPSGKH